MLSTTLTMLFLKMLAGVKATVTIKVTTTVAGAVAIAALPVLTLEIVRHHARGKAVKREKAEDGYIRVVIIESNRPLAHWLCKDIDKALRDLLPRVGSTVTLA